MQRRKDETLFAVAPSVLARVLCRYCTACGKRDSRRQHPIHCPSVKRFIAELRDKSAIGNSISKITTSMKERNVCIIGFVCLLISVAGVLLMCMAIDHAQQRYKTELHNVDSLRSVNRALIEQQREAQLKTLEDSIHYYEDGY